MARHDQLNDGDSIALGGNGSAGPAGATYCPACHEIVGTGGGNCPHCGAFVPLTAPAPRHQMPVRLSIPEGAPPAAPMNPLLLIGGAFAGLVLLLAVAFLLMDRSSQVDPPSEASVAATEAAPASGSVPLPKMELSEVERTWADANQRAKAWADTALLFDAEIGPIQKGQLARDHAAVLRFRYAVPSRAGFTEGTPLGKKGLLVSRDQSETKQTPEPTPPGQVAVTDPLCPFSEVVQLMKKWGAEGDLTTVRFGFSKRFGKAVWTLKNDATPPVERTLDANECALMVR